MSKIVLKALAGDTNANDIDILDGVDCQDDFVEYMDEKDYPFVSKLKYGYMSFEVDGGKLYTITEYDVAEDAEPLTPAEIEQLIDYTQGQWSDGIGEGFEQFACAYQGGDDEEVFVSPWYRGQKVTSSIE